MQWFPATPQYGTSQQALRPLNAPPSQFSPPAQFPQDFYGSHETARKAQLATATPQRRNRLGCTLGFLGTLLVVALLLGAAWVYVLHPYVHNLAVTQMDSAMTDAVNQIPAIGVPVPPGTTIPIAESTLNTILANDPNNPSFVHNTNIQITASLVLIDFQVYGQECMITAVPQVQNGKLVATHVGVSGIARFLLSPDDITTLLNSHLEDAQTRINHRVTNIRLLDQEIDITVS